jgi:hypothetical protein
LRSTSVLRMPAKPGGRRPFSALAAFARKR